MSDRSRSAERRTPDVALRALPGAVRAGLVASAGLLLGQGLLIEDAVAGPQGGKVVAGQGRISAPDAKTTRVQQQSHSLAINWQTFNVKRDEQVHFSQPSSSSTVLNRVLNQSPSQIFGSVRANGQVFILNAGGVVIGEGARVNVGGLFVSSLDISDRDFMSGNHTFTAKDGEAPGAIVNRGLIEAASGGSVSLVGGRVANEGIIVADMGHVNLAAGRTATLDFDGDGLVRFEVSGELLSNADGADAAVSNAGEIRADGGQVRLSARAANRVFDRAVNNSGVIRAGGISRAGGKVTLTGLGGGVRNSGTVDVSGATGGTVRMVSDSPVEQQGTVRADGAGGRGGVVHLASLDTTLVGGESVTSARATGAAGGLVQVLGERVAVHGRATVDTSGSTGGGTIQIGGGLQGADPLVANATAAFIGPHAVLSADALTLGDGGTVIVWSEQVSRVHGTLTARGGREGGDGGLIETSSRRQLDVSEIRIDASADAGVGGRWLLDPFNVTIVQGADGVNNNQVSGSPVFTPDATGAALSNGTINAVLDGGTDVDITTADTGGAGGGTEQGNVVQNSDAPIVNASGGARTLRIFARGDVALSGGISGSAGNPLSVVIDANDADGSGGDQGTPAAPASGDVTLDTNSIFTFGGDFSVVSGTDFLSTGVTLDTTPVDGAGGSVNIATSGAITVGNIDTSGDTTSADTQGFAAGTLTLNAGGGDLSIADVRATGSAGAGAQAAVDGVGGAISLTGTRILLGGDIDSAGGDLAAGGQMGLNSPVVLTGNRLLSTGLSGGDITFASPLDADAAASLRALGITAGSGDVTFTGDVGVSERTGDVTIDSAGNVHIDAAFSATGFTQTAGSGTTRTGGAGGGGGAMDISNALSIATGAILLQDDVTAAGTVTLASAAAIGGSGKVAGTAVSLSAAGGISLATDADSLDVQNTTAGNVAIVEDDDVVLVSSFSNAFDSGTLSLVALDGSIDTNGVAVSSLNGMLTLDARDGAGATPRANLTLSADVTSGTGAIALFAADDIAVGGAVTATGNTVNVTANNAGSEAVVDADGAITTDGSVITGSVVTLRAEEGIDAHTAATTLDVLNGVTAGDVTVSEADDVTLSGNFRNSFDSGVVSLVTEDGSIATAMVAVRSENGAVTLAAQDAAGGTARADLTIGGGGVESGTATIELLAADDVAINGFVRAGTAANTVTIIANDPGSEAVADGVGAISGSGLITGTTVTLDAEAGITATTAASLLDVLNGVTAGAVLIGEADDVSLVNNFANGFDGGALSLVTTDGSIDTGGVDVAANNGAVTLDARDATDAKADVTVNGGSVDSGTGAVLIAAADDVTLNGDVTAAGMVTVEADRASSDAVADADGAIGGGGTLGATTLSLMAGEGVGAIATDADTISAATGTGGIDLVENDDVVLSSLSAGGGDITVVAGSDIAIGLIANPTGDVSVTSTAGDINDASANPDTTTDIDAVNIVLTANSIGQTAHVDLDAAASVSLTTDTAGGDISVVDADNPLALSGYTVSTTGASQDVSIQAGSITVDSNVLGNATDNLVLVTTMGGISDGGAILTASNLTLDVSAAAAAAIGATGGGAIDTVVTGLLTALTDGGGGGIFINDTAGDLDIAGVDAGAGSGHIEITSAGDISQSGPILGNLLSIEAVNGVVLGDAANDVTSLVADVGDALLFVDANALIAGGGGDEVSGDGVTLSAGTTLTLADDVESSGNSVSLSAGGDLIATAGMISGTVLTVNAGGTANLDNATGHAVTALAGSSAGNVTLVNNAGLALGFVAGGDASITTLAGNVSAGSIAASNLVLNAARGIGSASALQVEVPGTLGLTTLGSGAAGNITVTDVDAGTALATSRLTALSTDVASAQTIVLADADGLVHDADRLMAGDTLRFSNAATLAATAALADGSTLQFAGSTTVEGGANIGGGPGSAVLFGGAVSVDPGQDFTVSTPRALFASNLTLRAGQTLNLNSPSVTQFVGNTSLVADNVNLGGGPGSIRGTGILTILNASAQPTDTEIGGADRQFSNMNLIALNGFGGTLNIGGTRDTPPTASQLLNHITVTSALNIPGNVFLVGAGDVSFDTTGAMNGAINAGGTATVVALGSGANSGNIVDSDDGVSASGATPKVIRAATVELLAANRIGAQGGAGGGNLNVQAVTVSAAQAVEGEALVDRVGGTGVSDSVLPVQLVYANAASGAGALAGLINSAFLSIGGTAELTTVSLSTPKQAEDEIGFIDEGVFLLPPAFTSPERALLMPLLGDPDFPGDQRPQDPDDDAAWAVFFDDVVREFITSRHPLAEDAGAAERAAVEARITEELQAVIAFYDTVRERERRMLARDAASDESSGPVPAGPDEVQPGEPPAGAPPADPSPPSASLPARGNDAQRSAALTPGYVGDDWRQGGIGIDRAHGGAWPVTFTTGG